VKTHHESSKPGSLPRMRWYVSRNGESSGPVEEAQVAEWVRGGMVDAMLRDEAGGNWMRVGQSPFAQLLPATAGSTLIPWRNKKALIAYYCGVFSLIPGLALLLGPIALFLGISGRRFALENPQARGGAHAWAGITLGALSSLVNYGVVVTMLLASASRHVR